MKRRMDENLFKKSSTGFGSTVFNFYLSFKADDIFLIFLFSAIFSLHWGGGSSSRWTRRQIFTTSGALQKNNFVELLALFKCSGATSEEVPAARGFESTFTRRATLKRRSQIINLIVEERQSQEHLLVAHIHTRVHKVVVIVTEQLEEGKHGQPPVADFIDPALGRQDR